jgi:hypothetical protein
MRNTTFFLALALAGGAAVADPIAGETGFAQTAPPSRIGVTLGLGGGVTDYTRSTMNDASSVGGTWELRATVGTRKYIAAEAAYVGSRRNLNIGGVTGTPGESPHVFSHGLEAALRAQYPVFAGDFIVEPFAFGGIGWSHVGLDGLVSTSQVRDSSDLLVVPMGAGIAANWNRFVLEARFTYRSTFNDDLLVNADGSKASLSNWSTGALVGYEF